MTTYRLLGNSGLRVHPLCLGTMLFGEAWKSRGQSCTFDEAEKILMRYLELGGNFIDTSNFYQDGESEETVGKILKKNNIPRHRYVLASKFSMPVLDGPNGGGNSKKNIVQSIDATLKRLQVDYLDIYYVHFWDFTVDIEQLMRWLDDTVIKTGKALHIALSDAPAWQGAVANTLARNFGWSPFVAYQGKYSLLDRSFDQEVLPMARKMSMGVIPWGVTGENKLVGTSSHAPDEREKKIADKVAEIAKELNCMPVQVCYAWVINRPGIVCALVGPGTLVALENMMMSMDVALSEEHMKALTEVSDTPLLFPYSLIGTDTDSCQSLYGTKRTFSIDKRQ